MFYLILIFPAACIAAFLLYFTGNNSNHAGFEFLVFLWPLSFLAALSGFIYKHKKARRYSFSLCTNILAIGFFLFIDHFNIMVQYDKWLWRGMPLPFEASRNYERDYPEWISEGWREARKERDEGRITLEEYDRKREFFANEMKSAQAEFYARKKEKEERGAQ